MNAQRTSRVLVVGPGRNGRGGITSVILAYASSRMWSECDCGWLETYDDRGAAAKILTAAKALVSAPMAMRHRDIIHIHATFETSLFRKSLFLLMAKALGKRVIVHIHATDPDYLNRAGTRSFTARVLRAADSVIALSPRWAKELSKASPRVVVVPNPVVLPKSEVAPAREHTCPTVLYVGKVEVRKGYLDLIRAMSIVSRRFPGVRLVLAGHGEVNTAKMLARDLGIADSVDCLGWVSERGLPELYRCAEVFCLPSYHEGVPMSILEAMSFGLPVVCTPVGGLPDLIRDNENGIFVRPGDVNQIAQAIGDLLRDSARRQTVGRAAFDTVKETCSLEVVTRQIRDLYAALLRN